jgi:hypothetical protein
MIICPNCQDKAMSGAIFCGRCGAQLIDMHVPTHRIKSAETSGAAGQGAGEPEHAAAVQLKSRISLNILERGEILPLADRSEFTLGRSAAGQPIVPDVDLTTYDAYAKGISRLHAVIKFVKEQATIMDLDSSNGTFLNGKRLTPYIETACAHGDAIALGRLKIQLLIQ